MFALSSLSCQRWTVKDLQSGHKYSFRVRLYKSGRWSDFSDRCDNWCTAAASCVFFCWHLCVLSHPLLLILVVVMQRHVLDRKGSASDATPAEVQLPVNQQRVCQLESGVHSKCRSVHGPVYVH